MVLHIWFQTMTVHIEYFLYNKYKEIETMFAWLLVPFFVRHSLFVFLLLNACFLKCVCSFHLYFSLRSIISIRDATKKFIWQIQCEAKFPCKQYINTKKEVREERSTKTKVKERIRKRILCSHPLHLFNIWNIIYWKSYDWKVYITRARILRTYTIYPKYTLKDEHANTLHFNIHTYSRSYS